MSQAVTNLYLALVDDYADGASIIELMSQVQRCLSMVGGMLVLSQQAVQL